MPLSSWVERKTKVAAVLLLLLVTEVVVVAASDVVGTDVVGTDAGGMVTFTMMSCLETLVASRSSAESSTHFSDSSVLACVSDSGTLIIF